MQKKLFFGLLAAVCALCLVTGLTACNGDCTEKHAHTYSTEWSSDETYHWHAATCAHKNETSGKAEHSFVDGVCTICNYHESENYPGSKGLKYELSPDSNYYSLTSMGICTDTDIVIASQFNGLPVQSIGGEAFAFCTAIESVTIPDSVTEIGYGAFYGCVSLTNLSIPESVTRIQSEAFSECTQLIQTEKKSAMSVNGRSVAMSRLPPSS